MFDISFAGKRKDYEPFDPTANQKPAFDRFKIPAGFRWYNENKIYGI